MAVLGLRFCARAFSSCGKWGPLFIAVRGPLTIAASLVTEHRLQTRRLSNCGSRAQLLRGMWDPPRPGLEPVSPALAGRLSTTAPPGKPWSGLLTSGKVNFRTRKITRLHFIMIKGSIHQEGTSPLTLYATKNNFKIYKANLTELKGKLDKSTITVGDFYTPVSVISRASRQKRINRNLKI